jgi:hypothetical protein
MDEMSIKDTTEEISHFIRNDSQSFFNEGEKACHWYRREGSSFKTLRYSSIAFQYMNQVLLQPTL